MFQVIHLTLFHLILLLYHPPVPPRPLLPQPILNSPRFLFKPIADVLNLLLQPHNRTQLFLLLLHHHPLHSRNHSRNRLFLLHYVLVFLTYGLTQNRGSLTIHQLFTPPPQAKLNPLPFLLPTKILIGARPWLKSTLR